MASDHAVWDFPADTTTKASSPDCHPSVVNCKEHRRPFFRKTKDASTSFSWPKKNPRGLFFSQFKPVPATIQVRKVQVPV